MLVSSSDSSSSYVETYAEIRTASGEVLTDQQQINNEFNFFYTSLYTSETKGNPSLINNFLSKLKISSHRWKPQGQS